MEKRILALAFAAILLQSTVFGWWDMAVKRWKLPPTIASYEAEELVKEGVVEDGLAPNGKAVEMKEGSPPLTFTRDLKHSTYCVYVVARSPRKEDIGAAVAMKPFYFHVKVEGPDGIAASYRIRAVYQHVYALVYGPQEIVRAYFVAPVDGTYTVTVSVGPHTEAGPLWVDRVDLSDVLFNCAGPGQKKDRYMISDAARAGRAANPVTVKLPPAAKIQEVCESLWQSFPPMNASRRGFSARGGSYLEKDRLPKYYTPQQIRKGEGPKGWEMNAIGGPWKLTNTAEKLEFTPEDWAAHKAIEVPYRDDGWGKTYTGLHQVRKPDQETGGTWSLIGQHFQNRLVGLRRELFGAGSAFAGKGDLNAGLRGTALLLAFAYHYPALDYRAQVNWGSGFYRFGFTNHVGGGIVGAGQVEGHVVRDYIKVYDQLFDFIKDNQALADFLNTKLPWIKTPDDVITFLDTQWLRLTVDRSFRKDVAGRSLKMTRAVVMAALCQGPNEVSDAWIKRLFTDTGLGLFESGSLEDLYYSFIGRDGVSAEASGGYSKGKIMGYVEVLDMLRRYEKVGGKLPVAVTDFSRFPFLAEEMRSPIRLRVAGGWVPLIGDYGDPLRLRETYFDGQKRSRANYLTSWRLVGGADFAFLTQRYGKMDTPDDEWAKLTEEAKTVRDPLNTQKPRVFDDFGMAILEMDQDTDDFKQKKAAVLRYGTGHTHGHNDGLSVSVFGKGMRAISDLAARYGTPNPRLQKMHNTVEVDESSMNNSGDTVPGGGWLNVFAPCGEVQYVDASYRAVSHPQLKVCRRGVALIEVDDDDGYLFSVQRVAGGKVHTFCAHANLNDSFETNATLGPLTSEAGKNYLKGFKPDANEVPAGGKYGKYAQPELLPAPLEGIAPDITTATWRLDHRCDAAFHRLAKGASLPEDQRIYSRWRLFGHAGDRAYAANATSRQYRYDMSFIFVQNRNVGEAGSIYPALAEVYQGSPVIQQARSLKVTDPGTGASSCIAIEVALPDGTVDLCMSGPADGAMRRIEGGYSFDGMFGFVRLKGGKVVRSVLVGGTALKGPGLDLTSKEAVLAGKVESLDLKRNAVVMSGITDPDALQGRVVQFVDPKGRAWSFTVDTAERSEGGVKLVLRERMKIFQTEVRHIDEATGTIETVAEAHMLKADGTWYDFTTMTNESATATWTARAVCDSKWMMVKTPMNGRDVPDVDGDGKRTLKLVATEKDAENAEKGLEVGDAALVMEVTRVDEEEGIFHYRMPAERTYQLDGWAYVSRTIVSESGKTWMATYPGSDHKLAVEGKIAQEQFDDVDGDGRAVLSLYRLSEGFQLRTPTVTEYRAGQ